MRTLWKSALVRRLLALATLFAVELAIITIWLDDAALAGRGGLAAFFHDWGASILRAVVLCPTLFLTFSFLRFPDSFNRISRAVSVTPMRGRFVAAHAAALALFGFVSHAFYTGASTANTDVLAVAWLIAGLSAIVCGAVAFVSPGCWREIARNAGSLWVFAVIAAIVAAPGANALRALWQPATSLTFSIVRVLLRPFGTFSADAAQMTISGARFSGQIAPACSGLEGIGLVIAFTAVWLVLFRRECSFPRALVLVPAGIAVSFLLNSVRIAALILLGNAGFERIATGGFHSQAGWIAFNFVALGICITAREVSWISRPALTDPNRPAQVHPAVENPTAAWVAPFVAILAAGMISRALSADFEWLYSLRIFAAVVALWAFRSRYRNIDWRIDWSAPLAGMAVFVLWIVLDHSAREAMPSPLAAAPAALAAGWIALRIFGAAITVPMAEELAFRGFLLRRLVSADFDSVPFRGVHWIALVVSSLIFGLLHGKQWIAGSAAGAIYAWTITRKGRLGNAVVAHALTNALLAADVLVFHHWELW